MAVCLGASDIILFYFLCVIYSAANLTLKWAKQLEMLLESLNIA